ncbi:MAG TPA: diguanylate cyclase [Longimicrobiales bacterium]|nr:diguanylate cyclase [Longimicrobiales bacterium]
MNSPADASAERRGALIKRIAAVAVDLGTASDEAALLRTACEAPARVFGRGAFEFVPVEGGAVTDGDSGGRGTDRAEPVLVNGQPAGHLRAVGLDDDDDSAALLGSIAQLLGTSLETLRGRENSRRMQQVLMTDRAYFEQLFASAPEAIVVLDGGDRIVRMNHEFERMFGYTAAEAQGRTINELIVPEDQQASAGELTRQVANGRSIESEAVRRRKDGSTLPVSILGTPIVVEGDQVAVYGIYRDITAQKEAEEELRRLTTTDDLTGLYNRRGFFVVGEQQLRLAVRRRAELLLLYIDIDDFKLINDTFGHVIGDQVLSDIGDLLRNCYRDSDIMARLAGATSVLARMGGDEFVVLAVDASKNSEGILLNRLRERLEEYNAAVASRGYRVSLSVGAVRVPPEPGTSLDDIIAAADRLMYADKRGLTKL